MKLLITGCEGQVGRCLVRQLSHNVELLALNSQQLDITQQTDVQHVIRQFLPDVIINAAAYTAVDKAETEQENAFKVNSDGALYLAQAADDVGACILHLSTDYVFDGEKTTLYQEDDIAHPLNVYGASKLVGEQAVSQACERHIILRTAWAFAEDGHNFVNTMLKLALKQQTLNIVADQFGAPTYAEDIAKALVSIVEQIQSGYSAWGIYHYCGSPYVSWFQFAQTIFEQAVIQGRLKKQPELIPIATHQYPMPAKRPKQVKLSCQKIEQVFGIKPSDWQTAIMQIVK